MSTLGPVDHLPRAVLPWRTTAERTECGKDLADLPADRVITVAELQQRIRDIGKTRAAMTACITCMQTANRWHPRADGSGVIETVVRELSGLEHASPPDPIPPTSRHYGEISRRWARKQRILGELEAITALVAAHREEFDAYLAGLAETSSLDARRRQRRARWPGGAE